MTSIEVFNKCQPKSPKLTPGLGGKPEITWEDVLGAVHNIPDSHYHFINFVYIGQDYSRSQFFANYYIAAMNHPDVKQWWQGQAKPVHAVERLVRLAMREWKTNKRYSANSRAYQAKVKRAQWKQYSRIYDTISAIPVSWESEVLQKAKKELRNIA